MHGLSLSITILTHAGGLAAILCLTNVYIYLGYNNLFIQYFGHRPMVQHGLEKNNNNNIEEIVEGDKG